MPLSGMIVPYSLWVTPKTGLVSMHSHSRGPKMGAPALTTKCLRAMNMSENIRYQGGCTGEVLVFQQQASPNVMILVSGNNKTELGL